MAIIWVILSMFLVPDAIQVEGDYHRDNQGYIYGSYQSDGYLLCYDTLTNQIIYEVVYEGDYETSIIYLADMNDGVVMVVRSNQFDVLVKYTDQGQFVDEMFLDQQMDDYHNHHGYLVVENDGDSFYIDPYFNEFDSLSVSISSKEDIFIQHQGDAYINGELVQVIDLERVGIYEIEIIDGDYIFRQSVIIKPSVIYHNGVDEFELTDDLTIDEPIQIFANVDEIRLNGQVYVNATIDKTGHYDVTLINDKDIIERIRFTLLPRINGIKEGVMLNQEFIVFGDAYLNDEPINGYVMIDQPGNYDLVIYFDDEVYQRYHFIIEETDKEPSMILYICIGVVLIGFMIKFLKK